VVQREVLLPVTKVFTMASGTTKPVYLEDTGGTSIRATYATLIDLSGGIAVNVGLGEDGEGDADAIPNIASTSSLGSTAWMKLTPGSYSGTDWTFKAHTSGVGYTQGSGLVVGPQAGIASDEAGYQASGPHWAPGPLFSSAVDSATAPPGVVGPMGTSLILATMIPFNMVTVGNHSEEKRIFALTYGVVKNANSTKDQEAHWAP